PNGLKGWLFYNPETRKMVISERAIFDECYFPGNKPSLLRLCPKSPPSPFVDLPPFKPPVVRYNRGDEDDDDDDTHRAPPASTSNPNTQAPSQPPAPPSTRSNSPAPPEQPLLPLQSPPQSPLAVAARRRFHRETTMHRPAGEWWRVTRNPPPAVPSDSEDSSKDEILLEPGSVLIVAHQGDPTSLVLQAANVTSVQSAQSAVQSGNPRSYHEALRRADAHLWEEVAVSEINSLLENCT
ncbi:hypothetical protein B0H17DRAFT_1255949, partial [Mycena rosella]